MAEAVKRQRGSGGQDARSERTPFARSPRTTRLATDPWAWVTLLSVLPLAWRMRGSAWGEPVAEDFDFLNHALFHGVGSLFDGGGSQAFWRPIPHQLYYAALARPILDHPALVTALHLFLLAAAAVLWYRTLRPAWSGPLAAAAASFPILAESTRTIAGWPTQFVDLGLYLFSAIAVHEASRRRLWTSLTALLAALLCKEVAVVTGVLLPLVPVAPLERRERGRLAIGAGAVTLAWGIATLVIRARAHLVIPERLTRSAEAVATPLMLRVGWAVVGSLKSIVSLPIAPGAHEVPIAIAIVLLVAAGLVSAVASPRARAQLARNGPWIAWGIAWFVLATLPLVAIFPSWQPNRAEFGSVGLGIAAVAALSALHPAGVAVLVGIRLVALFLAPGAIRSIEHLPPDNGAFMDYPRLTRLQRFMRDTRAVLQRRFPTLPHGAIVVQENLPHSLEYAFGGDHALRAWYADSTLHWMRFGEFREHLATPAVAIVQGEPQHLPEVAIVEPDAVRGLFRARDLERDQRFPELLRVLDHADSVQRDTNAIQYRITSGALRSYAYAIGGRAPEAGAIVARLVPLEPTNLLLRQVLALAQAEQGRFPEAFANLDTLRALDARDSATTSLRAQIEAMRARARPR